MKIVIIGPANMHLALWKRMYEDVGNNVLVIGLDTDLHTEKIENTVKLTKIPKSKLFIFTLLHPLILIDAIRNSGSDISHYIAYKVYARRIKKTLSDFKPEFIHAHYISSSGFLALETGFKPFMISVWGSDLYIGLKSKQHTKWLNELIKNVTLVHVESNNQKQMLTDVFRFQSNKIIISNWGIDPPAISSSIVAKLKQSLNIKDNEFIILSARRLVDLMNIETLLEVAVRLVQNYTDIKFIFASFGPLRDQIIKRVHDLSLENKILVSGYLSDEEYRNLFFLIDIYIQAPKSDGVSLTLMDAMVNSKAVLTTNVGDNTYIIEDSINGFFIEANVENILEKIIYLKNNPEIKNRIGRNAKLWADTHFDRKKNFEHIYNAITEFINR